MLQSVGLIVESLTSMRSESAFSDILKELEDYKSNISYRMDPLKLPRKSQPPKRFDGCGEPYYPSDVDMYNRQSYYEFIDTVLTQINDRFSLEKNTGLKIYKLIEDVLLTGELNEYLKNYPEIDYKSLSIELPMYRHNFKYTCLNEAAENYRELSNDVRVMFTSVYMLIKLLLVFPVSSCESERPFLNLRRLKSWLRNV